MKVGNSTDCVLFYDKFDPKYVWEMIIMAILSTKF